jgi:dihydrolipoamide dehydrogenase
MPSKLIIAAADAARDAREAAVFGVHVRELEVNGRDVMARVRAERDRFVGHVLDSVNEMPSGHRLHGHARFLDPHQLAVGDDSRVRARRIIIATGSSPNIASNLEPAGARLITNDALFEFEDLPESVAVFGAGVVGLELAQALHRLGVRVKLFGLDGLVGPLTDPEVKAHAAHVLQQACFLDLDAEIEEVRDAGGAVEVRWRHDGRTHSEAFEYVLAATGRRPTLEGLDLGRSGLELDDKGAPHFDRLTAQCGDSHIFIAGDADGDLPLLHEAADDGRIAGDNAGRFPDVRCQQRRVPLTILFTRPEIALLGSTWSDLSDSGHRFAVGATSYEDQGRARVNNRNQGMLRVYGECGTGIFLGAEMIAPAAEHLAHLLAWAAQRRLTVQELLELPYYHPTVEEGVRTAFRELRRELRMGPASLPRCLDCGPGG